MSQRDATGDEPGLIFDKPQYDTPDYEILYHVSTPRYIAVLIICIVTWLMILALIWPIMGEFKTYSQNTRFPSPTVIFFASLIMFLLLSGIIYFSIIRSEGVTQARTIFWFFMAFNVFLVAWTVDLTIFIDEFVRGQASNTGRAGSYLGALTVILALVLFYYAWKYSIWAGLAMVLILVWLMYLLYNAWFD